MILDYFVLLLSCLLLSSSSTLLYAQPFLSSTSKLPTTWVNQPSLYDSDVYDVRSLTPVLLRENHDKTAFFCGFYCNITDVRYDVTESRDCVFGVHIFLNRSETFQYSFIQSPILVWSANRNNPVQVNATLRLSEDGGLVLRNSDGTLAWSSNTGGKSVAGMNLTEEGNLVLFGPNNEPIWQSFDHPTDFLLLGQRMQAGQRLIASVSASNWSEGLLYVTAESTVLAAYAMSNPPQRYGIFFYNPSSNDSLIVRFRDGYGIFLTTVRFMRLGPDGHLRAFQLDKFGSGWEEAADLLSTRSCDYPMVCGAYGVCSDGQCDCVETSGQGSFFTQNIFRQPSLGCSLVRPISCDHSKHHTLLELNNTSYFAFNQYVTSNFGFNGYVEDTLLDDCKSRCLKNCSCKAAVFGRTDGVNPAIINGSCLLLNDVFSIANDENSMATGYDTTLYVKVQLPHSKALHRKRVIFASSVSAILGVVSVIGCCFVLFMKLNKQWKEAREDFLENVPGMPARYSYAELKAASGDFSEKLGEGGFGSVYEGSLDSGTKIAVKCLDGIAKVKDSFLVEVKTIGSIHHVNLVKLIGFCFEKSHRLLVYEYMSNKSLDGWIFDGKGNTCLPWDIRKRIISEIAKGLAYLHEDCSQKIIHLDIKPQNILLDHNFNAKIGDFGLSKLIEKDQSQVITTMRGTPGYLAPEWLSSVITEKVDVYSFGVVVLEIICGRKNLDRSKAEEDKHLLSVFMRKAEEENLEELVDENSEDMQKHVEEAVEMMMIAAWCLQGDYTKRPSMSVVVKVLEGLVEAETNLKYDFLNRTIGTRGVAYVASELPASALSGPR